MNQIQKDEKMCKKANQILEKSYPPNKEKQDCIKEFKYAVQEAFSRKDV
jgi:hypothetical protein